MIHKRLIATASSMVILACLQACGGGMDDDDSGTSGAASASSNCSTSFPDLIGYSSRLSKYSGGGDAQCKTQVQYAESIRKQAIEACSVPRYNNYRQAVIVVNDACP